jgi:hypothetical protein
MGVWNGGVIPQLTQNVIKRLGGNVAWRHAILFALGIVKTIRISRIERQKMPPQNLSNKGFGAFWKIA